MVLFIESLYKTHAKSGPPHTHTPGHTLTPSHISTAAAFGSAFFGPGTGPIHIDTSQCAGTESNLLNCTFEQHTGDCNHLEDASVRCASVATGKLLVSQCLTLCS